MPAAPASHHTRRVVDRDDAAFAAGRCLAYAVFSELVASPFDLDVAAAVHERLPQAERLPWVTGAAPLLQEFATSDAEALRAAYSGLFEVGSDGPPAPIREDLMTGQKGGTREEIVRFYDYFGYRLGDRHAWAPDHLSVELEFMHFLAWHEAQGGPDLSSYQLAQADFAERHLVRWVPLLRRAVDNLAPGALYARVLGVLEEFLHRDVAWQRGTIVEDHPGASR